MMRIKTMLLFTISFTIIMTSNACRDTEDAVWMNQAEITGHDYRLCPCCGGLFIEIGNETYRFYNLPNNSSVFISSETTFPIPVNVNWHLKPDACLDDEIIIDAIEEQN